MSKRAAAVAQTKRRIVDATRELHTERGIAATSWDDIAARAGVGVGTVYRHFPTLDELVPACGAISMQIVALPDPMDAPRPLRRRPRRRPSASSAWCARRSRSTSAGRRICACPQRASASIRASPRPASSSNARSPPSSTRLGIAPADRPVVRAMIDLGTWQALREQGLGPAEAVDAVSRMLAEATPP